MFDLFTFIAQIINFLILVWLLKKFLYAPILQAMDRRELEIKTNFEMAESKTAEAESKQLLLEDRLQELETLREKQMEEMRLEVAQEKDELMNKVKSDIEEMQSRWRESLEAELKSTLETQKQKMHGEIVYTVRRIISDLSGQELEDQIVYRCINELRKKDLPVQNGVLNKQSEAKSKPNLITVRTTFPLSPKNQEAIRELMEEKIAGALELNFDQRNSLIAGIEIIIDSHKASWSVADYLDTLDQSIRERLAYERN